MIELPDGANFRCLQARSRSLDWTHERGQTKQVNKYSGEDVQYWDAVEVHGNNLEINKPSDGQWSNTTALQFYLQRREQLYWVLHINCILIHTLLSPSPAAF